MMVLDVATLTPLEIFAPRGADDILERLKAEARALSADLDISTPLGRKQIASLALKVARSKTFLDDAGKELVSGWKEQAKTVDAERKRIREELDALKDEVRAPLTAWENAEAARVKGHEEALAALESAGSFGEPFSSADVQARLDSIGGLFSRDWQEFLKRAEITRDNVIRWHTDTLSAIKAREAEEARLERLRREDADRRRHEREERIKADAAAKAKEEAEARAKAEAAKAEQARLATERARQAAESRAAKAESDRVAAEEKAQADARSAAERSEREKAEAVQAERDRAEAARRAEADAAAKREADKKHRARVNNEVLSALASAGLSEADARTAVEAIAKGLVPHVRIQY